MRMILLIALWLLSAFGCRPTTRQRGHRWQT